MDNIINIQSVDADTLEFQNYQTNDSTLISSFNISDIVFNLDINKIEYHVLDYNKNIIFSNYDFKEYTTLNNDVVLDFKADLEKYNFNEGQYYVLYHFFEPILNSSIDNTYYISLISSDRTELRISSNVLNPSFIISGYNDFVNKYNNTNYFPDFYLNFGENDLIIANNILLDGTDLLIKLYEPLPQQFDINSEFWSGIKLADSIANFIELISVFENNLNITQIKGPNFNIFTKDKINNSTLYTNYNTLQSTKSSSLSNQLNNILNNKSIRLNIDYTDYNNFIHFSSAETRLENFYYKLSLLEQYNRQYISSSNGSSNYYLSSSQNVFLNKIKEIEEGLDGYEYHLYYNSGSTSWPKSNTLQPYINYATTSSLGNAFLITQLVSASLYDSENKDALINNIPLYLREDPNNAQYELFIEMLGQHFDTLYLYYGEVTNKYNSDNRINYNTSKDVISDILRDFGIKIYQNNFSTTDLYSSFLGITSNLGLLPPTGSELITNYVTASNSIIPLDDVNTELYKRIYHNLPLLYKKKGTIEGLRLLINIYGIPDTILRISEFGGKNKINTNDWDQFQNQFNYEFFTTSSGYLIKSIPLGINSSSLSSIEFRFKSTGIPVTSSFSQSLASFSGSFFNVVLEYSGSGYTSGSYDSSIPDTNNQYGTLKLIDKNNVSASIYLPFFNKDWWSVLVTTNNNTSSLYTKNKIYSGYDGNKIGFQASSSVLGGGYWIDSALASNFYLSYPTNKTIAGKTYAPFSGSFQELRFYSTQISQSVFDDYVMNPYSIESNQLSGSQSSYNSLIFRAPLGSLLDISGSTRNSIHPKAPATTLGTNAYTLSGSYSFLPNTEIVYLDQFPAGIKNIVSNKVKIENNTLPTGNVLSTNRSLQQNYIVSESYTRDTNYVEVAFSPQNEINNDISTQLGYFNIGDYIGDPRQLVNKNITFYPDFNKIRDDYFLKYSSSYNTLDYVRLIKYFDNSLFKLIKDFTPARTNLASGVVIKQHLLERNRYSPAQIEHELQTQNYTSSFKSFPSNYSGSILYEFSGGPGGMFPYLDGRSGSYATVNSYPGAVNVAQRWTELSNGPLGLSNFFHTDLAELFTGEFKGSILTVSTQSLTAANPFDHELPKSFDYDLKFYYDIPLFDYRTYFVTATDLGKMIFTLDVTSTTNEYSKILISKQDKNGVNNTLSLRYLQTLKVFYTNAQVITYDVIYKNEFINYFVLTIKKNLTNYSLDNNILDYNLSASGNIRGTNFTPTIGGVGATVLGDTAPIVFTLSSSAQVDPRGYYTGSFENPNNVAVNVTASIYTIKDYINIPIAITASGLLTTNSVGGPNKWAGTVSIWKYNYVTAGLGALQFDVIGGGANGNGLQNQPNVESVSTVQAISPTIFDYQTGSFNVKAIDTNPKYGDSYFVLIGCLAANVVPISASLAVLTINPLSASQAPNSNSILLSPFLPQPFEGTNYDVLYGSIDKIEASKNYQKVEYNSYNTINSEYLKQLLSGSAKKADVKDFYYQAKRHIYPRYNGSRNSSDNFNTSSIIQVNKLQTKTSGGLYLYPSKNQSVADNYDTLLYEFSSINTPFELPFLSKINVNQMINTDTTSSAVTVASSDPSFAFIKEKIKNNDLLKTSYYNASFNNLPFTLKAKGSLSPTSYNIWSSTIQINHGDQAVSPLIIESGSNVIKISTVGNVANITTQNNSYILGTISPTIQFATDISESILSGESWYLTLYTGSFTYPISISPATTLTTMINSQIITASTTVNSVTGNRSVFKIISSSIQSNYLRLHCSVPTANGQFDSTVYIGSYSYPPISALLWKDNKNGGGVLIDKIPQNINSQGNFTTPTVLPFIQNNLDYIAQNFGNKPKT